MIDINEIMNIFTLVKLIVVYYLLKFAIFIFKNFIRKRIIFSERYGSNSWVLVTGATDGIGKVFCQEFAREGFNIILVSRTMEKLKKVEKEISQSYPNIKTHTIEFDFSKKTKVEEYMSAFSGIQEKFDISILVNNVGMLVKGYFCSLNPEDVENVLNTNVLSQALLTKIFLDKLSNRNKRSAIIDLSSIASVRPIPGSSLYAATKSFNHFLSRGIAEEVDNFNVDVLCVKPGWVSTPLTGYRKQSLATISPEECVNGCLNDLGYEKVSEGHWRHKIFFFLVNSIPDWLFYRTFIVKPKRKIN